MNHTQILKRAWTILWGYKTLWVFGIILALTSASFNNGGNQSRYEFSSNDADNGGFHLTPPPEIAREFEALGERLNEFFSEENLSTLIGIIVGLVCLGLLLFTVFRIANYVSQVALIRMVDQYETSGEKVTWKQGFRLGWSRQAWQLFLVDLVIFLPLFVIVLVLIGCAALPLIASSVNGEQPAVFNIVTAIGISFMAIFLLIVIGLVLSLVMELIRRVCVLEERGAIEAIRQGVQTLRSHFKDVFLMWLILVGVNLAYFVVMIPVLLLVLGVGVLLGGGLGFLTYSLAAISGSQLAAILWAVGLGLMLFIIVISIPLGFLGGLRETFFSTTWTLTYREIKLVKAEAPEVLPPAEPAPAG